MSREEAEGIRHCEGLFGCQDAKRSLNMLNRNVIEAKRENVGRSDVMKKDSLHPRRLVFSRRDARDNLSHVRMATYQVNGESLRLYLTG